MLRRCFGVQSVKETQNDRSCDHTGRTGNKDKQYGPVKDWKKKYTEFLGNRVVCHSIPIRPGRNLAIIVESASVNHRQKQMGYNAAQELYRRVQENLTKRK